MLLGVVEENVYYRYMGEHIKRQTHLADFRVDMTRLSWAMLGEGEGKGKRRGAKPVQESRGQRHEKGQITKTSGLHREECLGWRVQGRG